MEKGEKELIKFGTEIVIKGMAIKVRKIKEKLVKGQTITKKEQKLYDNWYKHMSDN